MTDAALTASVAPKTRAPFLARFKGPWLAVPAILYIGLVFAIPVFWLLGLSLVEDGAPSAANYERLVDQPLYIKLLGITLKIAGLTTLFAVVGAYPVAVLLAKVKRRRNLLLLLVLMPFWTSFLVRAFAWMVLLGRRGAINQWLEAVGLIDRPLPLMFNLTGVLIGMVHAMLPLAVMTMLPVLLSIDRRLPLAAKTLGARTGSAFWLVWFPLSLPGVAAAGILVFVTSLGFFITPALLGSEQETVIVQEIIFQIQQQLNWGFAGAIGVLVLVTVLAILWAYNTVFGLSSLDAARKGGAAAKDRGPGPLASAGRYILWALARLTDTVHAAIGATLGRLVPARRERNIAPAHAALAGLILAFLAVPTLFIVPVAFTEASFLGWPPRGFSTRWFAEVTSDPVWIEAVLRSLTVGALSAGLGLLLGVPAAFALARTRFTGSGAVFALLMAPVIVPNIFIAVGLFYLFSRMGLAGTTLGLSLGHAVLAIPYVLVTVIAVVRGYDERLDLAAYTLGASRLQTLRRVTLPLIAPGLVSAFMFAFVVSFDELTIALFLTGGEMITLPKKMWDDAVLQVSPELAAASALLFVFMTALVLVAEAVRQRGSRT
ncbi:MAG: ABC transporter permease subunit [Pseudomonadota bacterium]